MIYMNLQRLRILITLAAFVAVCFPPTEAHGDNDMIWARLKSEDSKERDNAAALLLQERAASVKELEAIVRGYMRDGQRKGTVKTAIDLLGEFRSAYSVPLLVDTLTFGVFYKETKKPQPPEDFFPSVGALIKIGMPSIEPVLEKAKKADDEQVSRNAALVLKGVLGSTLGRKKLELDLAKESDQVKKQKLSRLLELIPQ
jgi:HEAT repeat protein